jgi:cellulose synthase/poly-beta-1,6-N-acetylglucosamine synthase-like glycosyltransferase
MSFDERSKVFSRSVLAKSRGFAARRRPETGKRADAAPMLRAWFNDDSLAPGTTYPKPSEGTSGVNPPVISAGSSSPTGPRAVTRWWSTRSRWSRIGKALLRRSLTTWRSLRSWAGFDRSSSFLILLLIAVLLILVLTHLLVTAIPASFTLPLIVGRAPAGPDE